MRILQQFIVGMVCVGICAGVGVCSGQTAAGQQALGSVQGRVVQEAGGLGIRKVLVQLQGENTDVRQEYTTTTDATGQFRIEGVPPGMYSLTITRAGFVAVKGKAEEATITVVAGEDVTGLVYKMEATGVIVGKITEADGDPLQGVTVWVKRVAKSGEPSLDTNGPTEGDAGEETTNDLGEYRIANLKAGQYIVQAQAHGMGPVPDPAEKGKQKDRAIYALTYYPGTLEMRQASPVQVTPGGTAIANFGVVTSGAYRVSGTVLVEGNPRNMQMFLVSGTGQTEAQGLGEGGKFEFQNILPGTYVAQIVDMGSAGEGKVPTAQTRMIASPIVVSDADVTGLQLQAEAGGSVNGKVRMGDEEKLDWTKLEVTLVRVVEGRELPQMMEIGALGGTVGLMEDGSFEFKDVAGATYQVAIVAQSDTFRDYYVKSVTQDGREVTDTGFRVSGETTLDVVMSAKGASIEGTVINSQGQVVAGTTVVSMPGSGKLGRPDSYQLEKTDASGHFVMRGMNPGTYVVVALDGLQEDVRKAEFFQKYGEKGVTVDLDEGDRKSITVGLEEKVTGP